MYFNGRLVLTSGVLLACRATAGSGGGSRPGCSARCRAGEGARKGDWSGVSFGVVGAEGSARVNVAMGGGEGEAVRLKQLLFEVRSRCF